MVYYHNLSLNKLLLGDTKQNKTTNENQTKTNKTNKQKQNQTKTKNQNQTNELQKTKADMLCPFLTIDIVTNHVEHIMVSTARIFIFF